jgi:hypothetical protein
LLASEARDEERGLAPFDDLLQNRPAFRLHRAVAGFGQEIRAIPLTARAAPL